MPALLTDISDHFRQASGRPLADRLPYGPMIDDSTMLVHEPPILRKDGVAQRFGLGKMWRLQPLNIDTLSNDRLDSLAQTMTAPLHQLGTDCVLEFRMTITTTDTVPEWEQERVGLHHQTIEWQREHIRQGMVHHTGSQRRQLTHIETVAGLRMPVTLDYAEGVRREFMLSRGYGSSDNMARRLVDHAQAEVNHFQSLTAATEQFFADIGLKPQVLETDDLLAYMAGSIAPTANYKPLYDPYLPVRENITIEDSRFDPNGFQSQDAEARVFTLRKVVGKIYPGLLSAARKPADLDIGFDLWNLANAYPLTLVVQIMMPDQDAFKSRLESRQNWAFLRRFSLSGAKRSDSSASGKSLETLNDKLASGNEKGVLMGVHLIAWGEKADTRLIDSSIHYQGNSLSMEFIEERMHGGTMFGLTLPLARDPLFPSEVAHVKRARSIAASDAVHYLPVWGSFTGHPDKRTYSTLLINQRNEAFTESTFDRDKPHTFTGGSNRTGKSAAKNREINASAPLGENWMILDRHGSYRDTCRLHGGKHLAPSFEEPVCFGPFDGPLDRRHLNQMAYTLLEMCTEVTDYGVSSLDNQEMAALRKLLTHWADHREPNRGIATLGEFDGYLARHPLSGFEGLCEKLRLLLDDWHGDGVYAPFIDGPNEVEVGLGLYSFDLYHLDEADQLLAVATAILFGRVERLYTDPRYEDLPKNLVADEVSFMLQNPRSWRFINRLVRALARKKAAFHFITQQMSDLEGRIGKVIANNCGKYSIFALNPSEIREVMTALELPDNWYPVLDSVSRHKDCSECVIIDPDGESGIARVVSDPTYMVEIGQSEDHKAERRRREERRAFGSEMVGIGVDDAI